VLGGAGAKHGAVSKDRIDKSIGLVIYLPLGQRPKFDGLCAADECVGKRAQREQARRTGEKEATGPRIPIHLVLDGQPEVGNSLYFVDQEQAAMTHEGGGIDLGSGSRGSVVKETRHTAWPVAKDRLGEGAFANLACAVDDYDACVRQRLHHLREGPTSQ
jgi:hypothetical protein